LSDRVYERSRNFYRFEDLVDWRVGNGRTRQPILLILSASGDIPVSSKFYGEGEQRVCILTTATGSNSLKKRIEDAVTPLRSKTLEIITLPSMCDDSLDLTLLVSHLFSKLDIKFLDVSCGGTVIQKLRDLKLVDEIRWTLSGQICGAFNDVGDERPTAFPKKGGKKYNELNSVHVKWIGVPRVFGDRLIFIRGKYEYRH
jgi:riboflavin biosynthesis pyrimidine reductase